MAFGIGDSLRVKVSAATKDFERGMENAQDSLNSVRNASVTTSGAIQGLQNRVNELGDEFSRTERKASSLSRSLGVLSGAVSALSVSVMGFNTTQLAGMITGFGTLLTTVVPLTSSILGLTAAVGGLASGFAAVIGTGFIAWGEQLAEQNRERLYQIQQQIKKLEELKDTEEGLTETQSERLDQLEEQAKKLEDATSVAGSLAVKLGLVKQQIAEELIPVGQEFIPLVRGMVNALPDLTAAIVDAMGPLGPFANALEDAGAVAMRVLPEMVGWFMQLGRESLPMLREFGSWLANNWKPILEESVATLRELTPELLGFIDAMLDLIPAMNDFGTIVLEEVLPALNRFSEALGEAMQTVRNNKQLVEAVLVGSFIAILGPLGAVIALLVKFRDTVAESLGNLNKKYIQPFVKGFNSAFDNQLQTVLDETIDTVDIAIQTFKDLFGLEGDAESWGNTVGNAANDVQQAIIDLNNTLQGGFNLESLFDGSWESAFDSLVTSTDEALGELERMLVGTGGSGGLTAVYEDAATAAQNWLQSEGPTVIRQGIGALVDATVDAAQSLSVILVGPDGESGILTEMVDQASRWLSETAPKLIGAAMEAVGSAIRDGLIDFTNPLRGKDSEIWDMLGDAATWLVDNIPQLMGAVGTGIVNAIINGVTGLVKGLVGNSVIKDAIEDAADIAINKMDEWAGGIGGAIVDAILGGLGGLVGGLKSALTNAVDQAVKAAKKLIPDSDGSGNNQNPAETGSEQQGDQPGGTSPGGTTIQPVDLGTINGKITDVKKQGGNWLALFATPNNPNVGNKWFDVDILPPGMYQTAQKLIQQQQTGGGVGGGGPGPGGPGMGFAPGAATGGFIEGAGLAMLHSGERVVPASQVTDRGEVETNIDPETIAEGVARGFSRVDNNGNQEITIQLEDTGRYKTVRR